MACLQFPLFKELPKVLNIYIPRVHDIRCRSRFTHYNFPHRNTTINDLLNTCPAEPSSSFLEQAIVRIITSVALIVKLYSIEIDCLTDLFVHCDISAVLVMLLFEVRGLGRMDDDMVGKPGSKCGLEPYQPLFSCTCFHRTIVLPVDIDTIQIIR